MILRIIVIGSVDPLSLRVKALSDGIASVAFLASFQATPDKLSRAGDGAVIFLDDLHPLTQSIVRQLSALVGYRIVDCNEPVDGVPFVRLFTIAREIAVCI